jgi:hypothetical protein
MLFTGGDEELVLLFGAAIMSSGLELGGKLPRMVDNQLSTSGLKTTAQNVWRIAKQLDPVGGCLPTGFPPSSNTFLQLPCRT